MPKRDDNKQYIKISELTPCWENFTGKKAVLVND